MCDFYRAYGGKREADKLAHRWIMADGERKMQNIGRISSLKFDLIWGTKKK